MVFYRHDFHFGFGFCVRPKFAEKAVKRSGHQAERPSSGEAYLRSQLYNVLFDNCPTRASNSSFDVMLYVVQWSLESRHGVKRTADNYFCFFNKGLLCKADILMKTKMNFK